MAEQRFLPDERRGLLKRLESERFDLVVLGGGITGAGILRDAALRGLSVALIERDDFASGTSSRSSKLVHGGLRYLEHYAFPLVFESTQERARLMRLARHVVRPLPFLMPVWKESRHGLNFLDLGLWAYDLLGTFRNHRLHQRLSVADLLAREPGVKPRGLTGGLLYYDAVTDDTRLTIENVVGGRRHGGVALNRVEARGLRILGGRVSAVEARDLETGRDLEIRTGCVVCAAGPWTEEVICRMGDVRGPKLRPTKGAHIVLPREAFPLAHAIAMTAPQDGRVMFAIPWHGATVIGTTDTDWEGSPDAVFASRSDVDYLLEAVRHHFPSLAATPADVVGTWAGLRPLIRVEGVHESSVPREQQITVDPRGVVAIAGGKMTTYRIMAQDALKAAHRFLPKGPRSVTSRVPLPYCGGIRSDVDLAEATTRLVADHRIPDAAAAHLVNAYGAEAAAVLALAGDDRSLLEPIHPGQPFLRVEILHACQNEMATTLEDVWTRRMPLFFLVADQGLAQAEDAAALMAPALGWDADRRRREVEALRRLSDRHMACVREAAPPA